MDVGHSPETIETGLPPKKALTIVAFTMEYRAALFSGPDSAAGKALAQKDREEDIAKSSEIIAHEQKKEEYLLGEYNSQLFQQIEFEYTGETDYPLFNEDELKSLSPKDFLKELQKRTQKNLEELNAARSGRNGS